MPANAHKNTRVFEGLKIIRIIKYNKIRQIQSTGLSIGMGCKLFSSDMVVDARRSVGDQTNVLLVRAALVFVITAIWLL